MSFPHPEHDHRHCVHDALARAERLCQERGARLTDQRRRVLELVWQSHRPLGAYELMDALRKDGKPVAPPTVYRALDFLIEQGLVHRLASLNAYIGCEHPGERHSGQFLICRACGLSAELSDPAVAAALSREAEIQGFRVEQQIVEIAGLCARCQEDAP
ncbi:MAG: transcriptional repressor [Gammaproteobacteria bacterium]|nr:transcriptional repressor [Gammaproteobacteria bacterium]